MNIERVELSEMNPAEYNPRADLQPGDEEYQKLKRSVETFGAVLPLVWNRETGNIVGGHQTYKVLKDLGYENAEVSVVNLPEPEEKVLNIALNRISGRWDFNKLESLLDELSEDEFNLTLTGFSEDELEHMLSRDDDSFLDEIINTDGEEMDKPDDLPTQKIDDKHKDAVNLNFVLMPDERKRVLDTLKNIQEYQTFVTNSTEALLFLVDQYQKQVE